MLLEDTFQIDGQKLDPNVTERIVGARLIGTMDGAGSVELDVWDGDGLLLRSGALVSSRRPKKKTLDEAAWARFGAMRLVFDGVLWRLAGVSGFRVLTLTFEDEVASLVRRHTRAMTASRGEKTRAEFIGLAASKVKEIAVVYRSPEEQVRQNVDKPDDSAERKGLAHGSHLTVKGAAATSAQRKNMETVLAAADRLRAGERATLALLVACIQESTFRNLAGGDRDSQGILQVRLSTAVTITPRTVIDPRTGQAHGSVTSDATGPIAAGNLDPRDVKECARVFLLKGFWGKGGAIKIAADNPDMQPGEIAQNVQGSATPTAYTQWENEAKAILDAWGGVGQVSTLRESFQFRIGGKLKKGDLNDENYWSGTGRLANDVDGWRRYAWRNVLWFVSDEWKFQRKPAFVIGPEHVYASQNDGTQPPVDIQIGQVDVGLTLSELTITARMRRWDGAPADVVELVDLGPISGKWLIWTNRFDLQRDVGELTLHRPAPKGPEPAPDTTSVVRTESRPDSGTPRQLIVAAAEKALKLGPSVYFYRQSRPMPASLFPAANVSGPGIVQLDCSAFATLVYRAAQAPDPNGLGYNGSGYTGTLIANGKRTSDPQPGDLVFYGPGQGAGGSPGHVGVYVGAGKVIEMGGNPGPLKLSVDYRKDRIGYYSYDLGG
jgi:hypothetical protein